MPLVMTAFLGGASVGFDTYILRSSVSRVRLLAGAVAGYTLGAMIADNSENWLTSRNWDADIMNAYDNRWMNRAFNAGGFGNNWIHTSHSAKNPNPKPY